MRRILCITAHPDDEAGNFGGTVAKYSDAGAEVELICLTAGEAARNRGSATSGEELAAMRSAELARSCAILGIQKHEVWSYPDSKLPQVGFYEAAGRLVGSIRKFRPQIVLTMGAEGSMTGHPDHGMTGLLATAAFHWAAQQRFFSDDGQPFQAARLFYATGERQPEQFPRVLLPPVDAVVDVRPYVQRKLDAFHAHTTQAPLFTRLDEYVRQSGGCERFHVAAATVGFRRELLSGGDLFAGMD